MKDNSIAAITRAWVNSVVVGLNLCPFAGREMARDRVRFAVTAADSEQGLLTELEAELDLLARIDSIETTLLIHPGVLQDFTDYNQFLELAEDLLRDKDLEGVYQIASFHPDYQFSQTTRDAAENYTNRSPFPMLHIIDEESLEIVLGNYPDSAQIPQRNIWLLRSLGQARMKAMLGSCFAEEAEE